MRSVAATLNFSAIIRLIVLFALAMHCASEITSITSGESLALRNSMYNPAFTSTLQSTHAKIPESFSPMIRNVITSSTPMKNLKTFFRSFTKPNSDHTTFAFHDSEMGPFTVSSMHDENEFAFSHSPSILPKLLSSKHPLSSSMEFSTDQSYDTLDSGKGLRPLAIPYSSFAQTDSPHSTSTLLNTLFRDHVLSDEHHINDYVTSGSEGSDGIDTLPDSLHSGKRMTPFVTYDGDKTVKIIVEKKKITEVDNETEIQKIKKQNQIRQKKFPATSDRKNSSAFLDADSLYQILDKNINTVDLLKLLSEKLKTVDLNNKEIEPTLIANPPNFGLRDYALKEEATLENGNSRLLISSLDEQANQFNFKKDYSYFEVPKCARAQNSTFCDKDLHYPSELIKEELRINRNYLKSFFSSILSDSLGSSELVDGLSESEDSKYDWDHYFSEDRTTSRTVSEWPDDRNRIHLRNDYYRRGGYICSSVVSYSRLKRAKNLHRQWKFVVNLDEKVFGHYIRQLVRLEQCIYPEVSCNYLSSAFNSQCVQKYNYQQLLSWTKELGLHFDMYRLPIACSCHFRQIHNQRSPNVIS